MFDLVKEVIVEVLTVDEASVTMEANLFDDLGADSLDSVELSLAIEEKSGITIEEEAMAELKTVADIVKYLEDHQ